jgi:hypothetical protein
MIPALSEFILSTADDGSSGVVVVEGHEFDSVATLLSAYPALSDEPDRMALSVNQFARNTGFEVILDPAAYEAGARARIALEDPAAPFIQGVYRLRDFGIPDFTAIHGPRMQGDQLEFFAEQAFTGLPYRVTVARTGEGPVYEPVPLDPLPAEPRSENPDDTKPVPDAPDEADAPLDQPEITPYAPDTDVPEMAPDEEDSPPIEPEDDTGTYDQDDLGLSPPDAESDDTSDQIG